MLLETNPKKVGSRICTRRYATYYYSFSSKSSIFRWRDVFCRIIVLGADRLAELYSLLNTDTEEWLCIGVKISAHHIIRLLVHYSIPKLK